MTPSPLDVSTNGALFHLFAAYFDQDWDLDHESSQDVVAQFASEVPASMVADALRGFRELAESRLTEDDLQELICGDLRSEFSPVDVGLTWRDWIAQVMPILARRLLA